MARVGFQGEVVVTAAPGAACAADDNAIGDIYYAALLPAGLADNGPDTWLSFYGYKNAFSIRLANSALDANSPYTAVYINTYGRHLTPLAGRIGTAKLTPAPSATTPFVNVTVQISNFFTTPGCAVTLEGSFIRRRR